MSAQRHGRHDEPEIGTVAAHDGDIGPGGQQLGDLRHPRGRFLVNHEIGMLEDPQQRVGWEIGLDARRVVVDAEREIGCIGDSRK